LLYKKIFDNINGGFGSADIRLKQKVIS